MAPIPTSSVRSPSSGSRPRFMGAPAQRGSENSRCPSNGQAISTDAQKLERGASFINHAAVLDELEPGIGLTPPGLTAFTVSQEHIDQGASVLDLLGDLKFIQKYIDKWFSFAGGVVVIEPMVEIYLDVTRASWHRIRGSHRTEDLRDMSAQIWNNTSKPLSQLLDRNTTAHEFFTNVTGTALRWEVIGIIVSLVSLVAQPLKDGDPIFCFPDTAPVDRAELALSLHHASEMCVEFCDNLGVLNDLYLWLLYENFISYCSLRSRGGHDSSRKASLFVTAFQCGNLHQKINVDDNTPLFIAELRKRLFICAYSNDKSTAAFAG
ncbi:uncharacterized protein M421DRAFT_3313 [Didymella exigua CBS 183.55]|uniref:Transcription factor domain-containing protein n=1 Tax=Didymella exigua CBS 183.55 TaxID=1150837 RepID=A0A6A5RSA7_9PLEO|nr:uncharacterized protein M421DRAFT_3313 [Didymella exigua CBS 183.55]KAF1930230.1 hypothetical protein M421DRAFT_3313 [Didymella exigua CBS 183.55]